MRMLAGSELLSLLLRLLLSLSSPSSWRPRWGWAWAAPEMTGSVHHCRSRSRASYEHELACRPPPRRRSAASLEA